MSYFLLRTLLTFLTKQTTLTRRSIGLHHPLDGVTNPEYKLLHFIQLPNFFVKRRRHQLLTRIGASIQCSVYGRCSSIELNLPPTRLFSVRNATNLTSLLCDGSCADASSLFNVANFRVASASFSEQNVLIFVSSEEMIRNKKCLNNDENV